MIMFGERFNSAIRDPSDNAVDAGYYGAMLFTYTAIFTVIIMVVGLFVQCYYDPAHRFEALVLGQAMGLISTAYGALLLSVGGFKHFDRPAPGTIIKSSQSSSIESPIGNASATATASLPQ